MGISGNPPIEPLQIKKKTIIPYYNDWNRLICGWKKLYILYVRNMLGRTWQQLARQRTQPMMGKFRSERGKRATSEKQFFGHVPSFMALTTFFLLRLSFALCPLYYRFIGAEQRNPRCIGGKNLAMVWWWRISKHAFSRLYLSSNLTIYWKKT